MTKPDEVSLCVRIIGTELPGSSCGPYRGVCVGIQTGKEIVQRVAADVSRASWEVEVTAVGVSRASPSLKGPAVQGRGDERFFYLTWLAAAGDSAAEMFRRAKLQLDGVSPETLKEAARRGVLIGTLTLTDATGMPLCASVRPPRIVWTASDR